MTNVITLEKCRACKSHVSYQNGSVIYGYYKVQEERTTGKTDKDIVHIINCPKKVDERR